MGLFKKQEKKDTTLSLPKLPELPELQKFDSFDNLDQDFKDIHKLPSFPTNPLGEKFSQDTIKNAVLGERTFNEEGLEMNLPEKPALLEQVVPPESSVSRKEISSPEDFSLRKEPFDKTSDFSKRYKRKDLAVEPIFVRIDKFEESLRIFEDAKEKIKEMETLLRETRALKRKEEEELSLWESEIDQLKKQLEKVDKDIFSKIE